MIKRIFTRQLSGWQLLALLLTLQLLLIIFTYKAIIFNPLEILFCNQYDGIKNYFTYQFYINEPWNKDPFYFTGMNYPFGDTILYSDNTPVIAVMVKVICTFLPDAKPYALYLYNLCMMAGILLSSFLVYHILKLLLNNKWLIFFFSLILPWVNPQLLRLQVGHFNLSLSAALLVAIYCLLRLYLAYYKKHRTTKWVALFAASLILFSFMHMYFLALILMGAGFFFLAWFIYAWYYKEPVLPVVSIGSLALGIPTVVVFAISRILDPFPGLRIAGAEGYDYIEWKLNFSALFTPYSHFKVRMLFEAARDFPYESYAYLGAFVIVGGSLFILLHFFGRKQIYTFQPLVKELSGRFLLLLGAAGLANLFISLGDTYHLPDSGFVFNNYFNIIRYLRKLSDIFTQFRCLGRFTWIFFWSVQLGLIFLIDRTLEKRPAKWFSALIAVLLILSLIDMKDSIRYQRKNLYPNILTNQKHTTLAQELVSGINPNQFQAIMTLPFYHVGSEFGYIYTIDPDEHVSNTSMQLSLLTGLPLMASKIARTPPEHARLQFTTFLKNAPEEELLSEMNEKPVLVIYNKAYFDGRNNHYKNIDRENARKVVEEGAILPQKYQMQLLKEVNDWAVYSWNVRKTP